MWWSILFSLFCDVFLPQRETFIFKNTDKKSANCENAKLFADHCLWHKATPYLLVTVTSIFPWFEPVLWIQIHWIWIRIQNFGPNLDPDPGLCYQFWRENNFTEKQFSLKNQSFSNTMWKYWHHKNFLVRRVSEW